MNGLLAEFGSEEALQQAARRLRTEQPGAVETYTPAAPTDEGGSALPLIVLIGGLLGAAGAYLLQDYATTASYAFNIGGRPNPGWPALMIMVFEVGVMSAVAAGVLGFFIVNRLPALYDPIDEVDAFRRASRDGFFIAVRSSDDAAIAHARAILSGLSPLLVTEFPA